MNENQSAVRIGFQNSTEENKGRIGEKKAVCRRSNGQPAILPQVLGGGWCGAPPEPGQEKVTWEVEENGGTIMSLAMNLMNCGICMYRAPRKKRNMRADREGKEERVGESGVEVKYQGRDQWGGWGGESVSSAPLHKR